MVILMLKACKYCGHIHAKDYICDKKPQSIYIRNKDILVFRNSTLWQNKRDVIKSKDKYLCQACLHNLFGTMQRLTTTNLSVHHIKPLHKAWDLRLDDANLITLCDYHHELAEAGTITEQQLYEITTQRESDYNAL